jgi:hypothetical protein
MAGAAQEGQVVDVKDCTCNSHSTKPKLVGYLTPLFFPLAWRGSTAQCSPAYRVREWSPLFQTIG